MLHLTGVFCFGVAGEAQEGGEGGDGSDSDVVLVRDYVTLPEMKAVTEQLLPGFTKKRNFAFVFRFSPRATVLTSHRTSSLLRRARERLPLRPTETSPAR